MDRLERCDKCKFWEKVSGCEHGYCRRYPETVLFTDEHGVRYEPNVTEGTEWCGEFKSVQELPASDQPLTSDLKEAIRIRMFSPSGETWKSVAESVLTELRLVFQGTPGKPALIPDFCKPGQDMVTCLVPLAQAYLSNLNRIKTLESRLKMMTKTVNQWASNDDPEQF